MYGTNVLNLLYGENVCRKVYLKIEMTDILLNCCYDNLYIIVLVIECLIKLGQGNGYISSVRIQVCTTLL